MKEKTRAKKSIKIIIFIIVGVLGVCAICLLWGMKEYMDAVPKIYPKAVVTIPLGQDIEIEQVADFDKAKEARIVHVEPSSGMTAEISQDGKSIHVDKEGEIEVTVEAVGTKSERRQATVKVKIYSE